jgi:hypothetical protein
MKFKRAQSATALVAVVAGIIILYILFLPPAEREALLNDNETEGSSNGETSNGNNLTLLLEKPNRLEYLKNDKYDHNLQAFSKCSGRDRLSDSKKKYVQ